MMQIFVFVFLASGLIPADVDMVHMDIDGVMIVGEKVAEQQWSIAPPGEVPLDLSWTETDVTIGMGGQSQTIARTDLGSITVVDETHLTVEAPAEAGPDAPALHLARENEGITVSGEGPDGSMQSFLRIEFGAPPEGEPTQVPPSPPIQATPPAPPAPPTEESTAPPTAP